MRNCSLSLINWLLSGLRAILLSYFCVCNGIIDRARSLRNPAWALPTAQRAGVMPFAASTAMASGPTMAASRLRPAAAWVVSLDTAPA